MIVLDSSFLISFYLSEDSNHLTALSLAEKNIGKQMLLSDIILHETLTVLNYKKGIKFAKEAYDELIGNKDVNFFYFTDVEREEISSVFFDQKVKLSFADVCVIYLANKSKSDVLAFDKNIMHSINK